MTPFLTSPLLSSLPYLSHGFFTRAGGVSDGLYASLNCGPGSGDDPAHVAENRRRAAHALGAERLNTLYQVHGNSVVALAADLPPGERPEGDALVTETAGIALGVLTADCAPILLADAENPLIAAAHAGWKGAQGGVVEAAVDAMKARGARRIVAAIGPCIGWESYEIGPEFLGDMLRESVTNARFFLGHREKTHFHLAGYVREKLVRSGVERVEIMAQDTYSDETRFFSNRRRNHRNEPDYGRQVSVITIKGKNT